MQRDLSKIDQKQPWPSFLSIFCLNLDI